MAAPTLNSPFFDRFPKIQYDINTGNYPIYEVSTDIFFRIGVIKDVLKTIDSYYVYEIKDGETPDILANRIYGDSGVGWMILYANDIYDPQFGWPLDYRTFNEYIKTKYGSIDGAKSTIHHYEKLIVRTNEVTGIRSEKRHIIDGERITRNLPEYPYSYYTSYLANIKAQADTTLYTADNTNLFIDFADDYSYTIGALPVETLYETINLGDGQTIYQETSKVAISNYDYENELNEQKRFIKVIRKEYYEGIMTEFLRKAFEGNNLNAEGAVYVANYIRRLNQ